MLPLQLCADNLVTKEVTRFLLRQYSEIKSERWPKNIYSEIARLDPALGHKLPRRSCDGAFALPPTTDTAVSRRHVRFGPCVDGSEFGKAFLHECSIGRCSHVFGLT